MSEPSKECLEKAKEIIEDKIFELVSMAANLGMNNPKARAELARVATDNLQHYFAKALQLHGEEMYKKGADENKTADSYFERLKSETRRKAIEEAANIIKTWHISKGGFGELEFQVRKLLEVKP